MRHHVENKIKKIVRQVLLEQKTSPKTAKVLNIKSLDPRTLEVEINAGSDQGVVVDARTEKEASKRYPKDFDNWWAPHRMRSWPRLQVSVVKVFPARALLNVSYHETFIQPFYEAWKKGRPQTVVLGARFEEYKREKAIRAGLEGEKKRCQDAGDSWEVTNQKEIDATPEDADEPNEEYACVPAEFATKKPKRKIRVKRCGPRGKEYGQKSWKPQKLKSKEGDPEYEKFYTDLKNHDLFGKLGNKKGDYWFGWRHRRAYRALLCKVPDLGKSKPESPAPEKPSEKPSHCAGLTRRDFALMNKNRMHYGLEVIKPEDCHKLALIRVGEYTGLTRKEARILQVGRRFERGPSIKWNVSEGYVLYKGTKYNLDAVAQELAELHGIKRAERGGRLHPPGTLPRIQSRSILNISTLQPIDADTRIRTYENLVDRLEGRGISTVQIQKLMTNYIESRIKLGRTSNILHRG